jgi:glucose-6-phosphate 1-epimerase
MSSADDLHQFEIPGTAIFRDSDDGQLVSLDIATPAASGCVILQGAHVVEWTPAGAGTVLFMSQKTLCVRGKAIRGGVPLIFPWFGARAGNPKAPQHGFARTTEWAVESVQAAADQSVTVVLRLDDSEQTRASWPYAFTARFRATFGAALTMALEIENRSPVAMTFEEALHTYFTVSDVARVSVHGLENCEYIDKVDGATRKRLGTEPLTITGETDRVFVNTTATCVLDDPGLFDEPGLRRRIVVEKSGSDSTVVWNPWIEKARAMADFGDDEWPRMLCIETANAGENAVTLAPGATHAMSATIRLEPHG